MAKFYSRPLLVSALLVTGASGLFAQTDVTSQYIKNADFESATALTSNVRTYNRDINGTEVSGMQSVEDWTASTPGLTTKTGNHDEATDAHASGVFAYGTSVFLGGDKDYAAPATDKDGKSGNCLGIVNVWSADGYYTQNVTLPAGTYTLTADVYNSVGGTSAITNEIGFKPVSGTATYGTTTQFGVGTWTTETVTFTLAEETDGQIVVGYKSNGGGSSANPHLFIDNLKLTLEKSSSDEPATPTDISKVPGDYYLYDANAKLFLSRGANWGTEATADKYGVPFTLSSNTGKGTIIFKDATGVGLHIENNGTSVYTDNGSPSTFAFVPTEGGYYLVNQDTTSFARHDSGDYGEYVNMTADSTKAIVWSLLTKAQRDSIVALYPQANKEAVAKAAGITGDFDETVAKYVASSTTTIDPNKYTWTKTVENQRGDANKSTPREVFQGEGSFATTISGLAKGLYKVSLSAFYRDGSNANCVALNKDGYNISTAYLLAGDQQVNIKGWAEDRVADNNPNSVSEAGSAFEAGKYANDVYVYVPEDNSNLDLKVVVPSFIGSGWFIMGNTVVTSLVDGTSSKAYDEALAAAKAALADTAYANVTGEEKAALEKAVADYGNVTKDYNTATEALSKATTAFTAAKASYDALVEAQQNLTVPELPYAAAEKKTAVEDAKTVVATSAADATAKKDAIATAVRAYYESNSVAEGVEGAVSYTDKIVNADAEDGTNGWTLAQSDGNSNITTLGNEPYTDAAGNSTHKYFDGGNWGGSDWTTKFEQTLTDVPAGKYILAVTSRGSEDLTWFQLYADTTKVDMPHTGASNGTFNRGWEDNVVEFSTTEGNPTIGVTACAKTNRQWQSFTRFRLTRIGDAVVTGISSVKAEEGRADNDALYNLAGQKVGKDYKGIVIKNGKKIIKK